MIALFQDQIAEHQTLAEHYRELAAQREKLAASLLAIEQEASGAFQAIADITQKIQDSRAIATFKSALLNLFDGGNDDGGNQPTDPTNPAGGGGNDAEFDILAFNGETGECLTTDDPQEQEDEDSQNEQYEEEEQEDEDFQEEQDEDTEDSGEEDLIFHPDNKAIAWIPGEDDQGKLIAVIGFQKKATANSWRKFIEVMADAIELGEGKFLEGFKYELYCYGLSMGQISRLAECDFTQSHRTEVCTAVPPESKKKFQPPLIGIGTKVTRLLTPSEVFEASTAPSADGTFFAKSVLNGDRHLLKIDDVAVVAEATAEGMPKAAVVLLPGDEWQGQCFEIVSQSQSIFGTAGYTLRTPSGDYWYSADSVDLRDEKIEAIAEPMQPTERIHPVTKRPNCVQPAFGDRPGGLPDDDASPVLKHTLLPSDLPDDDASLDTHRILNVGDIVQILSDRYPQFVGHVCTVVEFSNDGEAPIRVRGTRGIKPYHRCDLRFISKASEEKKELVSAGAEFDF